jgi:hypothetical protein
MSGLFCMVLLNSLFGGVLFPNKDSCEPKTCFVKIGGCCEHGTLWTRSFFYNTRVLYCKCKEYYDRGCSDQGHFI